MAQPSGPGTPRRRQPRVHIDPAAPHPGPPRAQPGPSGTDVPGWEASMGRAVGRVGDGQMDSSRSASDSWGAEPGCASPPPPPRPTVTPHRRGAAATSRVSLPPRPSRSATCFYQYEADPQGLPQVGSVLLLTGQPPLRHLEMISHDLHSALTVKTSSGRVGGVGREGPSAGKTAGGLQPESDYQRTPRLPHEAAP